MNTHTVGIYICNMYVYRYIHREPRSFHMIHPTMSPWNLPDVKEHLHFTFQLNGHWNEGFNSELSDREYLDSLYIKRSILFCTTTTFW